MKPYNFVLQNLTSSFKSIKKNPKYFSLSVIMDILFVIFYGFFIFWLMFKTTSSLFLGGKLLSKQAVILGQQEIPLIELIRESGAGPYLNKFLLYLLLLILVFYVIYCFFQAISWRYCNYLTINKKIDFYKYIKRFFKVNIFWVFLFLIYNLIAFFLDLVYVLRTKSELFPSHPILFALFLVLFYFILISYCLISIQNKKIIRKSFSLGIKKFFNLAPVYLVILIIFALIDFILKITAFNKILMMVLGFILLFPFISFSRIYFLNAVSKFKK